MINPRIIFMGTPEFAVPSLEILLKNGFNVVAVVTAPDKPSGRGMQLTESAVKKSAISHGIAVLQPEKLKSEQFLHALSQLHADLQVVVAFRMLPELVWSTPPMGTINLHGSLLPQYRGAAPINWAIINGEKETGITTFKLQHEIDTGNILLSEKIQIGEDETAGDLHDRMKEIGAEILLKTVQAIQNASLIEQPQVLPGLGSTIQILHAPKIFTETCRINWHTPIDEIHNLIRGLSPNPSAFTTFAGKNLKIYRSKKELAATTLNPGEFDTDHNTYLKFAGNYGFIHVLELQLEGKKKMGVEEFLRGWRI